MFTWVVNPMFFQKHGSLSVFYDTKVQLVKIINKSGTVPVVTSVPLQNYGSIELIFTPAPSFGNQRFFTWKIKYPGNFVINIDTKGVKPHSKSFRKTIPLASNFGKQQTPFDSKVYWQKRSDMARGKFARLLRYNELAGTSSDARLGRSFATKFSVMKYLTWKLNLTPAQLKTSLGVRHVSSQLSNSLVNCLVTTGFYLTYSAAKVAVQGNKILLNGQVINNHLAQLKVNDTVTLLPSEWARISLIQASEVNEFIRINMRTMSFVVLKSLNFNLIQLHLNRDNGVATKLTNPLNSVFVRGNTVVDRLWS